MRFLVSREFKRETLEAGNMVLGLLCVEWNN